MGLSRNKKAALEIAGALLNASEAIIKNGF